MKHPGRFRLGCSIALAACLGMLLPACSRKQGSPQRQITSIHSVGGYSEAARGLATEFERQTGIHVEIVEASLLSLREKELTDLLTGAGRFDVLQVAYQWEGEIFPHLKPLDVIAPGVASSMEDFIPAVRENCGQWDGRVYGLPLACDVITLLYRTDIFEARSREFEQAKGRPLRPPETWEEYLEISRFLTSDTMYGNLVMGREQCFTIWSGILYGMGGRLLDEQWRPVLNSEEGVKSLSMLAEMYKCAPPHSESLSTEANADFLHGRGAMLLAWPSLIWSEMSGTNAPAAASKVGVAVIPCGRPQLSSWSVTINPACKDIDAAARWLQFLVSPENTKRHLFEFGKGSPRISTYSDPECKKKIFYHSQLLQGLAQSQARLRISPSQEMSDYLDSEILRTIQGQTTPKAALDRTAARWREILMQAGYLRENSY